MNKFKEKLELLFDLARIAVSIPSAAFVLLFAVIWTVGGMEDQIAQRLGVVTLCSTVPAIVLNLIWLFTGNNEDNNESTERKNKDFHPYRKTKKHPRERRDLDVMGYNDEFGETYPIGDTPWFLNIDTKVYLPRDKFHSECNSEYPVRNEEVFKDLTEKILII